MRFAIIKPESESIEVIEDVIKDHGSSYDALRSLVEGYIEAIRLGVDEEGNDIVAWVNEEGKLLNKKPNLMLNVSDNPNRPEYTDFLAGNVVFTSSSQEGETISLTDSALSLIEKKVDFNKGAISPVFCPRSLNLYVGGVL